MSVIGRDYEIFLSLHVMIIFNLIDPCKLYFNATPCNSYCIIMTTNYRNDIKRVFA